MRPSSVSNAPRSSPRLSGSGASTLRPPTFEEGAEQQGAGGGQQQRGRFRHKLEREIVHGELLPTAQRKASVLTAKRIERQTIDVQIIESERRWAGRVGHDRCIVQEGCATKPLHFDRSEEHTSELQSLRHLVCRLLLE